MEMKRMAKTSRGIILHYDAGVVEFSICTDNIIRVRFNTGDDFDNEETYVVESIPCTSNFSFKQTGREIIELSTAELSVRISPETLQFAVYNRNNEEIVSSPQGMTFGTGDGLKIARLLLKPGERIYGLGQDPMGNLDQRDKQRSIWQEWGGLRRCGNVGMPFLLSSSGYGMLLNSSWASRFSIGKGTLPDKSVGSDATPTPWERFEASGENDTGRLAVLLNGGDMDIFIIHGPSLDKIHEGYAELTGHAPMLPRWVFGFIQCSNNYRSQEELLRIGKEFRKKGIPCDVLVKDWLWFKEFGDLKWAEDKFPGPSEALGELRKMGFHILLSQQPYVDRESVNYESFKEAGYLLAQSDEASRRPMFDQSNPEARKVWWDFFKDIFKDGVSGYWTDMGEPENHMPGDMSWLGSREKMHNIYTLLWNKGLYEGQRSMSNERVFILPRTNYCGIQRYGAALWSGDIDSSWEVLHEHVVIGQGVCLSGQQYWTTDIGGFLSNERLTPELYARWFEWGAFCPIFRTHGTRPENEPWSYGEEVEKICRKYIDLRYRLLPYIYSCSREVNETGRPLMRAMCMDFGDDPVAVEQIRQYMFGPAIMVAPVTEDGGRSRKVYLPEGVWYDFWSNEAYTGKAWINVHAPLDKIPLFVKAGSIIPFIPSSKVINSTCEYDLNDVEIRIYAGDNGKFELYYDDGLTYDYENGEFIKISLEYHNAEKLLAIRNIAQPDGAGGFAGVKSMSAKLVGSEERLVPKYDANCFRIVQTYNEKNDERLIDKYLAVDTCLETGGMLLVHATLDENCGYRIVQADFSASFGWKVLSKEQIPADEVFHVVWRLAPDAEALPLVHEGNIHIICLGTDGTEALFEKAIKWGSGYATRWNVLRFPAHTDAKALDTHFDVESNSELPYRIDDGKRLYWQRLTPYEFNCFGYVDLRRAGYYFDGEVFSDMDCIAFAKCRVWSEAEQTVFMDIAAEPGIKVYVNRVEAFRTDSILLETIIPESLTLKKGWNDVLVKIAIVQQRTAFIGRVFGFKFRFVNGDGSIPDTLLYAP